MIRSTVAASGHEIVGQAIEAGVAEKETQLKEDRSGSPFGKTQALPEARREALFLSEFGSFARGLREAYGGTATRLNLAQKYAPYKHGMVTTRHDADLC